MFLLIDNKIYCSYSLILSKSALIFFVFSNMLSKQRKSHLVRCFVCQDLRVSEKYRRHLRWHVNAGDVHADKIEEVIFKSKFTRKDSLQKSGISFGFRCTVSKGGVICGVYVKNIRTHLIKAHKLLSNDEEFISAVENANQCAKSKVFNDVSSYKHLFDKIDLTKLEMSPITNLNSTSTIESIPPSNFITTDSIPRGSESNLTGEEAMAVDSPSKEEILQFQSKYPFINSEMLLMINSFKNFLQSKWGGSKNQTSCKVTVTNLIKLFKTIGAENIWNPGYINMILSNNSQLNITATTLLSRFQSFGRFINYLKIDFPHALPPSRILLKIESMIVGFKSTLCKERTSYQKTLMSKNRQQLQLSLECLSQWRVKRKNTSILNEINEFTDCSELSIEQYKRFRDFFIPELLIPNAQRSGVIQGVMIEEVESAEIFVTPDGLHRLMVSNHKTGNFQSAALFLYPEVFDGLYRFVTEVLPKLPNYSSNNASLDGASLVFQTWSGSAFTSSLVGIRFRKRLANMGIPFNGTVTDLRKAAATLTGIHYPRLQELMSGFMCHTSEVQRKHYQVSMGHYGLTKAFNSLEKMQSNPFVNNIDTISSSIGSNHSSESQVLEGCSHVTQSFNDAPQQISSNFLRSRSKYLSPLKMKDFSIQLTHFDIVKPSTEVTKPISKHKLVCVKLDRHSLSTSLAEENLFLETFYPLIIDVANCRTITEEQVKIQSELVPKFNGSLTALTLKFPLTIYKLLYEKVKITGFSINSKRFMHT